MTDTPFEDAVAPQIRKLKNYWKRSKKIISDIVDDEGLQYVDLVMEGGGVLGISLVGYTYALESVGIRFLGVGGTSAGAIVATLLATLGDLDEPKSELALFHFNELELSSLIDGDEDAQRFIHAMLAGKSGLKLLWDSLQVIDNLRDNLGLNPGDTFYNWLRDALATNRVRTVKDLDRIFSKMPNGLRSRRDDSELSAEDANACLKLVAADVTTETKAVFPEMAPLYFKDPQATNPAKFVRASMSIPLFFEPFEVKDVPRKDKAADLWANYGYEGHLPRSVKFADGGLMSNFPIELFHNPKSREIPLAPTLGARLGSERIKPNTTERPLQYLFAAFNASRRCNDNEFLQHHPDYSHLVTYIPTGDHNWLNFQLTQDAKIDLFVRGVDAAIAFLRQFNWKNYKEVRASMVAAELS